MLPSDLLFSNRRGPSVYPRFLTDRNHPWAAAVLDTVAAHQGKPRAELNAALRALEGDSPDYRLIRGFAHLALNDAEFQPALSEPEPERLRHRAFLRAAELGHAEKQTEAVLAELAAEYEIAPTALRDALYADLPERQLLTAPPELDAERLVDRYNLAQAQGLLYSALSLRVVAHRNNPGEYRRLFQRLKFYGLLYALEGSLEDGYQIYVDGPVSLFKQTRRYGLNMALFLPALLQVSRWQLSAELQGKGDDREKTFDYTLNSDAKLRSHYAKPPPFDSLLERSFAERWGKLKTAWALEREVEIVDLQGTVFVPDFALRHPDGRVVHVEIVGFWHPDYLRRKLDKVRRAAMKNLILAVSERLNVGAEDVHDLAGPVLFFKGKLDPKPVLAAAEGLALSG